MRELPKNSSTRSTHTAMMASAMCPNCGRVFKDSSTVLVHMNHRYSSCHRWFANSPQPSLRTQLPPDTLSSHFFSNAGHVFDSGPGFLSQFCDEDTEARSINPYHLFCSKGEWEMAEFLLCSRLSMKLIDKFLSLSLVSPAGNVE